MIEITETDIGILNNLSNEQLAQIWVTLNHWEWPDIIPDPESPNYVSGTRRGSIMRWINDKIGFKECLREHNKERMTDEVFEIWWKNNEK